MLGESQEEAATGRRVSGERRHDAERPDVFRIRRQEPIQYVRRGRRMTSDSFEDEGVGRTCEPAQVVNRGVP